MSVIEQDEHWLNGYMQGVQSQQMSHPWELVVATFDSCMHSNVHNRSVYLTEALLRDNQGAPFLQTIQLVRYEADPGLYQTWDSLIQHVVGADIVTNWNVDDRKHPAAL